MTFIPLIIALSSPQTVAAADDGRPDVAFVVESTCTTGSKSCNALFERDDMPKGRECGSPTKGVKWTVPETISKEYQKEATELARRANKGNVKGLCLTQIPYHWCNDDVQRG